MTLDARDHIVAGGFPFLVVGPHDVTAVPAEDRGLADRFDAPDPQDEGDEDNEQNFVKTELSDGG